MLFGVIPSAAKSSQGCPFSTRCPYVIKGTCESVAPPLRRFDNGHVIACHLTPEQLGAMKPLTSAREPAPQRPTAAQAAPVVRSVPSAAPAARPAPVVAPPPPPVPVVPPSRMAIHGIAPVKDAVPAPMQAPPVAVAVAAPPTAPMPPVATVAAKTDVLPAVAVAAATAIAAAVVAKPAAVPAPAAAAPVPETVPAVASVPPAPAPVTAPAHTFAVRLRPTASLAGQQMTPMSGLPNTPTSARPMPQSAPTVFVEKVPASGGALARPKGLPATAALARHQATAFAVEAVPAGPPKT